MNSMIKINLLSCKQTLMCWLDITICNLKTDLDIVRLKFNLSQFNEIKTFFFMLTSQFQVSST